MSFDLDKRANINPRRKQFDGPEVENHYRKNKDRIDAEAHRDADPSFKDKKDRHSLDKLQALALAKALCEMYDAMEPSPPAFALDKILETAITVKGVKFREDPKGKGHYRVVMVGSESTADDDYETKPSKLTPGENVVRGSSHEYSLAKKRLKEYMENERYKLRKVLEGDDLKDAIAELEKRNKAYLEGSFGNQKFDGLDMRKSGGRFEGEEIFDYYNVDKNGGIDTPDAWPRSGDTEYKMLSEVAEKFGAKKGGIYPEVSGELEIVSELPYCTSCQGVIQDFSSMFPNVKVILIDNLKY